MQLNDPFASSPLLFFLWLSQVSISLFKYPPNSLHSRQQITLALGSQKKVSICNNSFKFLPLNNIPISAMSRLGSRWRARRFLNFPRPTPPPPSHFLRALAPSLSLFSHVSSTSCWSLPSFSQHKNLTQSLTAQHWVRVPESPCEGPQLPPEHRGHRWLLWQKPPSFWLYGPATLASGDWVMNRGHSQRQFRWESQNSMVYESRLDSCLPAIENYSG